MLRLLLPLFGLACAVPAARPVPPRGLPAPSRELWVDARAPAGGDGSARAPLRSPAAALEQAATGAGPVRIKLLTGFYEDGPYVLKEGWTFEGVGQVVLSHGGTGAAVQLADGAGLRNLSVQGGAVGVEVLPVSPPPSVSLEKVVFSGQREAALRSDRGTLRVEGCLVSATLARARGIVVSGNGSLTVTGTLFVGALAQGVAFDSSGTLTARELRFEGPVTGMSLLKGTAEVRQVELSGGRGPAVFVGSARVHLADIAVLGHEYGLLGRTPQSLHVERFSSLRADRAAISLVGGTALLEDLLLLDSGDFGAVQLVSVTGRVQRFVILRPKGYGLNLRNGTVVAAFGEIRGVRDDGSTGDGVHIRGANAKVQSVSIVGAEGSGVLAAEGAEVELSDVLVQRARWGAVLAESLARVKVTSLTSQACPSALVVPGDARIDADVVLATGLQEGPVWAECDRGAHVTVRRLRSSVPLRPAACVDSGPRR